MHLQEILTRRYGRRGVLRLLAAGTVLAAAGTPGRLMAQGMNAEGRGWDDFVPLPGMNTAKLHLAKGFLADVVVKWGDAIGAGLRFGFNNDFLAFLPLDDSGERGLLAVNHEYPITALMFPGMGTAAAREAISAAQVRQEMAAVGHSVLEVQRLPAGRWKVVGGSAYARRIDAMTPMRLTGPAAGHPRLRTRDDPAGEWVLGTLANCSGGVTPWGTVLIAEENIDDFFSGVPSGEEMENHLRMGIRPGGAFGWWRHDRRFRVQEEPNEPNRFGWMVEIDPREPSSTPRKRTALGRFKHEAAGFALAPDGRVVVYLGDDEADQYLYRFVSREPYRPGAPTEGLLDDGVLSVARFHAGGMVEWVPLIWGERGLTATEGFGSQADVLIEARRAGDVVKATPMDRPEDVKFNPVNGRVYVALTNHALRKEANPANPRNFNIHGHILELIPGAEAEGGHAAERFGWGIFLLADGNNLSCPDNITFDREGNLWVTTDGSAKTTRKSDGLFCVPVAGPQRGKPKRLASAPIGAEFCGPAFTPDGETLFLCVQHPGEGSSYDTPSTRWPEFKPGVPPKPSVVAIRRVL